jgi:hypothetical protein
LHLFNLIQEGSELVFVSSDYRLPQFSIEEQTRLSQERDFSVGDVVYFVDYFQDKSVPQEYDQWRIVFRDQNNVTYVGTPLMFVPLDYWTEIEEYFRSRFQSPSS